MKKTLLVAGVATVMANSALALSLQEGLEIVFQENPNLQTVKNELNVKEQQKNQARAGFMPSVTASYSLQDQDINIEGAPSGEASPSSGAVNLSQSLFTGGSTLAGFKAAKYNQASAQSNYLLQQQEIFKAASNAYLSVITAAEVLEFNKRQVATNTEEMKRIKQRFDLGDITLPDLKEFEARLSGYVADKEAAYGDLLSAKANFAAIFGRTADDLEWPSIFPSLPTSLAETIEAAKQSNPDIIQQQLLLKASEEGVKVARAGYMPTVSAVASWANNSNNYGSTDTNVTAVGVQASLPIFTGGSTTAKYKESKFQKIQAQDSLAQKVRDVEASATSAYNDVLVQEQRVKALKVSLDSFQITTDATEKQEEAGEASIIDVLDARDNEFSAKVNVQKAKQALLLAKFELLSSIGKFTHDDLADVFAEMQEEMQVVPEAELVLN
tara:strand:- start:568 stop:1890 length:1323 start_codon:yes stop_codon:yes gene_type:complete